MVGGASRWTAWGWWSPLGGIGAFLVLYFVAAALYPGGEQFDFGTQGYSHHANYWCDLTRESLYRGGPNPSRPWALWAMTLLPLSLVPFWLHIPSVFAEALRAARVVQVAGVVGMVATACVSTRWHDLAIQIAAPLGFTAFAITSAQLAQRGNRAVAASALLAGAFSLANYGMWQWDLALWAMPAVQKAALGSFFVWVLLCCEALRSGRDTQAG